MISLRLFERGHNIVICILFRETLRARNISRVALTMCVPKQALNGQSSLTRSFVRPIEIFRQKVKFLTSATHVDSFVQFITSWLYNLKKMKGTGSILSTSICNNIGVLVIAFEIQSHLIKVARTPLFTTRIGRPNIRKHARVINRKLALRVER